MRPLTRPEWRDEWAGARPADVLLDSLGRFCAACERRLPQDAVAWHATREEPIGELLTVDEWPDALPLCHNCAYAAQHSSLPVSEVLLPYRDETFTVAGDSPLSYTRALTGVDADARVLAEPHGDRAATTVGYFALNDHVPALGGELPLDVEADLLTRDWVDPRLELRTRAWDVATDAAQQIANAPAEQRELLLSLTRTLAADTGFWSTWVTVLSDAIDDHDALGTVLQPDPEAGVHAFPATRADWLPPDGARGG